MTEKNRQTLSHFDDERMIFRFLELPNQLFARHHQRVETSYSACISIQIALAISILTHAPVRASNLSSIRLGDNLIDMGRGRSRRVHLHFDAEDVKNGVALDFELPRETVKLLDFYLAHVRPRITQVSTACLFPNQDGAPKAPGSFSRQIAGRVEEDLGVRVTAHQFRHLLGYIYLRENPGAIEVVRQLHGHTNIETTTRFYAGMERKQALEHFDQFLIGKRTQRRRRSQPKGKRS